MLKQRVFTALLMLLVLIPAIFSPSPSIFAFVALVLISAAAWEWAKLNQSGQANALVIAGICAVLCAGSWFSGLVYLPLRLLWIVMGSGWVLFGAWLLRGGIPAWSSVPRIIRLGGGIIALWVAWLAVVQARINGINFLFSVLVLVWIADVFAYFFGRAWGGRFFHKKLAPSISPGKTWEGVCGGMLGVIVCAFFWRALDHGAIDQASIYTRLSLNGEVYLVIAAVFLAAMSVVGDLVESLFKRSAGVKDSSGLLPGHGGVLDRIDALLPILPLAMMLSNL